jgi:hypothetical protein
MQELKRARRKAERDSAIAGAVCIACRQFKSLLAAYKPPRKSKGVCFECLDTMEALGMDKSRAYRLGYAMQALQEWNAPRQGRA